MAELEIPSGAGAVLSEVAEHPGGSCSGISLCIRFKGSLPLLRMTPCLFQEWPKSLLIWKPEDTCLLSLC